MKVAEIAKQHKIPTTEIESILRLGLKGARLFNYKLKDIEINQIMHHIELQKSISKEFKVNSKLKKRSRSKSKKKRKFSSSKSKYVIKKGVNPKPLGGGLMNGK